MASFGILVGNSPWKPYFYQINSNKENLLLRIKAVQALDQLYYQKGEHLYSHRRVWRNHARRIFGINYTTYASYLRRDVSHLPDQPEVAETVRRLDEILNK